ncbi:iduronate 2-sulfatase-like [Oscarella lobularis]|uniref:iduronate 2-sulfatase-like n=1 Tax=Oscarella lobularis TaxID=121494 RepID=UPI0033138863
MDAPFCVALCLLFAAPRFYAAEKKNILFLVADDMKPELGSYDDPLYPVYPHIRSPNLDKLAAKSLVLRRAYVQQAVCSPSRASLLTGRRPDTTHVYDLTTYFRTVGGNFTTIPQYFKEHNYKSVGMGKIFHPGQAAGNNDPISWSVPYYLADNSHWHRFGQRHSWFPITQPMQNRNPLEDDQILAQAVKTLKELAPAAKSGEQPFFLAVGFHKPHLPLLAPEEFFDLYPLENISLPKNDYAPVGMPDIAWSNYLELRNYDDIAQLNASGQINTTLPNETVKNLRRAYYACVSYIDSLIGQVLKELENLGLADNTIISFFGDHGWHLGDHGEWCKNTNFESATRAPLMLHIPGQTTQGITSDALTEFVDIFPTLVEAAGFPRLDLCPEGLSTQATLCSEGQSFLPLINDPAGSNWKKTAFSQFLRGGPRQEIMGYSMRTDRYRYTEWVRFKGDPDYVPDWSVSRGVELYDHTIDPEENINLASRSSYKNVVDQLSKELRAGWRSALPTDVTVPPTAAISSFSTTSPTTDSGAMELRYSAFAAIFCYCFSKFLSIFGC